MEFAWNTQKNKLSDVKGKEIEQERKSNNLKNEDIDKKKTYLNYDLIQSDLNLYQRVKNRIEDVKQNSRIQKNSVVMYSNVITVNNKEFKEWGIEKTKDYFKCVTEFFKNEFGEKNVVSAKVHFDETTPHMHLHFIPISSENKLQAHKVMDRTRINKIHNDAPKFLKSKGFEVERGQGKTYGKNIKDIHKYKAVKLEETVSNLLNKKNIIENEIDKLNKVQNIDIFEIDKIQVKDAFLNKNHVVIDKKDFEKFSKAYKQLLENYKAISINNFSINVENKELKKDIKHLNFDRNVNLDSRNFYLNKRMEFINIEREIHSRNEQSKQIFDDLKAKELKINKKENELKIKESELNTKEENFKKNAICLIYNHYRERIKNLEDTVKIKDERINKLEDKKNQLEFVNNYFKKKLGIDKNKNNRNKDNSISL